MLDLLCEQMNNLSYCLPHVSCIAFTRSCGFSGHVRIQHNSVCLLNVVFNSKLMMGTPIEVVFNEVDLFDFVVTSCLLWFLKYRDEILLSLHQLFHIQTTVTIHKACYVFESYNDNLSSAFVSWIDTFEMSYKIYVTLLNAQFSASALTPLCILNNTRELLLVTASVSHTHTHKKSYLIYILGKWPQHMKNVYSQKC